MLGFTSSGCFVTGIILGFVLALCLGVGAIFYFNPAVKEQSVNKVESVWGEVKNKVDGSIDAVKNAPTAEPAIPAGKVAPRQQGTAPTQSSGGTRRPKIEIKVGI